MMNLKLFILLIIFQLKHFIADFPLQNSYMLGKFKEKGWILPLTAHAGVHAILTGLISSMFVNIYAIIGLMIFDFIIHFTMDRVKASPKMLGKYSALSKRDVERSITHSSCQLTDKDWKNNTYFWWSLGLDQMVHHITHYIIIYFLCY